MKWQNIKTAPKDRTPVDIWSANRKRRFANYERIDRGKGNVFYGPIEGGPCCIRDATHWMPIPASPFNHEA